MKITISPEQQKDADYFTKLSNSLPKDKGYKFVSKWNFGKDGYEPTRPIRLEKEYGIIIPKEFIVYNNGKQEVLIGDLFLCEVSLERKRELRIKKMINKIMRSNNLTYQIHKDVENTVIVPADIFSDVLEKVSGFNLHPHLTLTKGK